MLVDPMFTILNWNIHEFEIKQLHEKGWVDLIANVRQKGIVVPTEIQGYYTVGLYHMGAPYLSNFICTMWAMPDISIYRIRPSRKMPIPGTEQLKFYVSKEMTIQDEMGSVDRYRIICKKPFIPAVKTIEKKYNQLTRTNVFCKMVTLIYKFYKTAISSDDIRIPVYMDGRKEYGCAGHADKNFTHFHTEDREKIVKKYWNK